MCSCGKFFCDKFLSCGHPGLKNATHCIFDLDGTLVDTEGIYQDTIAELCLNHGQEYPLRLRHKLYGCTYLEVGQTIVRELKLKTYPVKIVAELREMLADRLPEVQFQIGAERLVKHLYENKVPLALATNSLAQDVRVLTNTKPAFYAMFHHVVTADDIPPNRSKPHPDLYLLAAAKFPDKPKPAKCVVFEDTKAGLTAAKAAGMQVVFIPQISSQKKDVKTANLILNNLLEFKPERMGLPRFTEPPPPMPNTQSVRQKK